MRDSSNVLQQQAVGTLGVNLIYAAFYEVQTKESFLKGVAQDVVADRIEVDYVDLRGAGIRELGSACPASSLGARRIRRSCLFLLQGLHRSTYRGSLQESRRACTGIFWPHRSGSLASSFATFGFGHSGASGGAWRTKIRARWLFLPDSCSIQAKRTSPGNSRPTSSHRCASGRWRRRAAFSPSPA